MPETKVRLGDGVLVEVDVTEQRYQQIAGGMGESVTNAMDRTLDIIKPTLLKVCRPVLDAWSELNQEVALEGADVELALSFDVEGNLYLAKAKTGGNIKIKLTLKPPAEPSS